jgi:hypothetical protein
VWDGHEVIDLAVGILALRYAEQTPEGDVAALGDKTDPILFNRPLVSREQGTRLSPSPKRLAKL